ncbi:unnamed protein product, partial [marine sediment metagenome]
MALNWDKITVGAIGAAFGILLAQLLNHLFAKDRARRERRVAKQNAAASEFKASFSDALINLSFREHSVALILQQTFTDHKVASVKFRECLSDHKRREFDEA